MINIVTGGAYGDEGKGKMIAYLAKDHDIIIRAGGGPQAGHHIDKNRFVCQVPSGLVNENATLCIGRGTVLNPAIVLNEIYKYNLQERIFIDPGCTVVEDRDMEEEQDLVKRIGSVGTGVGPARVRRLMRSAKIARNIPELQPYLLKITDLVARNRGHKNILIEGVQGYGLDLLDSYYYPYVTSQSTIASQFCADVGIGPRHIDNVYTCFKAYVTRVGIGDLYKEWSEEKRQQYGIDERGTISGRLRRVGDFDIEMAKKSIEANSANFIVINCVDRLFPSCKGTRDFANFSSDAYEYVENIVKQLNFKGVVFAGTGEDFRDIVRLGIV